jgi:hypothetical protein
LFGQIVKTLKQIPLNNKSLVFHPKHHDCFNVLFFYPE